MNLQLGLKAALCMADLQRDLQEFYFSLDKQYRALSTHNILKQKVENHAPTHTSLWFRRMEADAKTLQEEARRREVEQRLADAETARALGRQAARIRA
jgi:hypothetical protein